MRIFEKIGIILLLFIVSIFADGNNVGQPGAEKFSNLTVKYVVTSSTNLTSIDSNSSADDDEEEESDVDSDTIYVCGGVDSDKRCTCDNGTLSCKYYYDPLNHMKIKIRNKNFTVKFVDFNYNSLVVLKKNEILPGHESTIEKLDLFSNKIEYIEDGAFDKFTSLKTLILSGNSVKLLNDTFLTKQLGSTLESLSVASADLQNLTTNTFKHLSKLESLNLASNENINLVSKINGINVTVFPEALSNLYFLNLESCNLKYLDDNVFVNLRSLETLLISSNLFTTVPKAIKSLSNLRHLIISSSNFIGIYDCDFCNLPHLKIVRIGSTSPFIYINENAFGALNNGTTVPQLDEFSIQNSAVSILPEKLLDWENVSKINIEYPEFVCNCSMAWLINDYNASKPLYVNNFINYGDISYKNDLRCHAPSTLAGTHLHTLSGNFCKNETILEDKTDKDVYYVCRENDGEKEDSTIYDGCSCHDKFLTCNDNKFNHSNIQVQKNNFIIEHVHLSHNNITKLEKDRVIPGHEYSVKSFYLDSNKINYIENGTFEKFIVLNEIDLSGNNITNIHDVIFPPSLYRLLLPNSNLNDIPTFTSSTNIKRLDLGGNPKIFSKNIIFPNTYSKLEVLGLYSCNITTLDDNAFVNLQSLKVLRFENNHFTTIPTALNPLQNLQYLNLDGLNITVLKNDSFKPLKNLRVLIIQKSNLQKIDDCAFCSFSNLTKLDLSKSFKLSYIHENAFGGITDEKSIQLQTFAAQSCNISILSEKLLNWKTVSSIEIKYNPFTCNCSMAWLINDYNASKPLYTKKLNDHDDGGPKWLNEVTSNNNGIYCKNPTQLRYQYLNKLSGDFCLNETDAVKEEKVYQVCGENYDDETDSNCKCENKNLNCNSMNSTNIVIVSNKTIEITRINFFYGNISHLNLKNFVPENQHLIENLSFYHSNISSIENGTFNNFTALKTLDLSYNNLTNIDENFLTEQLGSTLTELKLGMNNLTSLSSKTFIYLTKLETLNLRYNRQIGNSVSSNVFSTSLSSLRHLFLTGCNISSLNDDAFINLKNLACLSLSENPITTFPTAINSLPNLQMLEITYTHITVLSKKNLNINKNFKYLFAHFSKIQRIEECAFCNFPNLQHVDLDLNENLSFIHENAFGYAHSHIKPSVTLLLINGCNLTTLPQNLLNWTSVRFHASKNPFICDCSMKWFIKLVKSKFSASHHPHYQCHGPAEFEGKTFHGLSDSFCNETTTTTASTIPFTSTLPSTIIAVTDASTNSLQSYRELIGIILSIFVVIALVTVVAGIYYYRRGRVMQIRRNGQKVEEDLLEEDFDNETL